MTSAHKFLLSDLLNWAKAQHIYSGTIWAERETSNGTIWIEVDLA